jgi:hypothetical protein
MADKRKILVGSYDVRAKRIQYLKQLQRYVHEERPIVYKYTDKSHIHSSHTQSKSWTDDSVLELKVNIQRKTFDYGPCRSKTGFAPNALIMFRPEIKKRVYDAY